MKIEGTVSLRVPRQVVWNTLTDPEQLTELMPQGEVIGGNSGSWSARLVPSTGLGVSPFTFAFELLDQRPSEFIKLSGHGYGAQNVVDLSAEATLADADDGTRVSWIADVRLGGVLASVGQRSLSYVVRDQVEHVLRAIERKA